MRGILSSQGVAVRGVLYWHCYPDNAFLAKAIDVDHLRARVA